jgi:hypothetical protein
MAAREAKNAAVQARWPLGKQKTAASKEDGRWGHEKTGRPRKMGAREAADEAVLERWAPGAPQTHITQACFQWTDGQWEIDGYQRYWCESGTTCP